MGRRGGTAYLVAALTTAALPGCSSGSQPHTQTPTTASTWPVVTTSAATTSASVDPDSQPAVDAYMRFTSASYKAEVKPRKLGARVDPAADFGKYSFDPVRGQEASYVFYLTQKGWARRGTPPSPHPAVASLNLTAKPYPMVMLTDCVSQPPTWEQYDVKTGKTVPDPYATVKPLTTSIQVIYYEKHWGVYKIDHVQGKPCAD